MRELVLDTETTGLYYENGDRIVEIGIVELKSFLANLPQQRHLCLQVDLECVLMESTYVIL